MEALMASAVEKSAKMQNVEATKISHTKVKLEINLEEYSNRIAKRRHTCIQSWRGQFLMCLMNFENRANQ